MQIKPPENFTLRKKQPRLAVGYECTPVSDAEKVCGEPRDILDATRHYEQFEADFDLQESLGVRELRYPAGWDKILVAPFEYDFERIAPIMNSMRRRGFVPTVDLCHHKAPRIIENGFANPDFAEHLMDFALRFQREFPFVERYTIINEPAVTALFHSSECPLWASHKWADVFLNMAQAISVVSRALKEKNPRIKFFQPEPIDHDAVAKNADEEIINHVRFLRDYGRFGMDNLLRGKISEGNPFYNRLIERGALREKILWFQKNPAAEYQKDLDFYVHCFKVWFRNRRGQMTHKINPAPPSLSAVIADYKTHLPEVKMSIGETNVRGSARDRITFFKWVLEQCALSNIERVSWWGLTDADLWGFGNLTRRWLQNRRPDPVGIFKLERDAALGRNWRRVETEFSAVARAYGNGQIAIADIPAYEFTGELKHALKGFVRNDVKRWRAEKSVSGSAQAALAA
jgi:beta-glucosidase